MKKILYIPSTMEGGVYYYRAYTPMKSLVELYPDEFDVTINNNYTFNDMQKDEIGKNFDLVIFHNCLFIAQYQEEVWKTILYCKKTYGTKFILDLDDFWIYGKYHPYNEVCQFNGFPEKMMINFKLFDYVTTTTEYFKEVISDYFPKDKIYVFENAIDLDDEQFDSFKYNSDLIRFGMTGGSSHVNDIKCLMGFWKHLSSKILNKIQIVLCGYDLSAEKKIIDENGKVTDTQIIEEKDNWWYQTEQAIITGVGKDHYKRIETKNINKGEYGQIYRDIDVLLAPLMNTKFNNCKSELKIIEAGFTSTLPMCSKVIPYSNFVTDETAVLVKDNTPEGWAKQITKIVNNWDKYNEMADKNNEYVKEKRDLKHVTQKRKEFFEEILK